MRHLLYHVYPLKNPRWRQNVDLLLPHLDGFDGQKIITIVTDDDTASVNDVVRAFPDDMATGAEWIVRDNHRDAAGQCFLSGMHRLMESSGDHDAIFYAHAKGVTRPRLETIDPWIERLYRENLKDFDRVDEALRTHMFAGVLKLTGYYPPLISVNWHYAGTFFWLRAGAIRNLDWDRLQHLDGTGTYYGIEQWPGCLALAHQAACLYGDQPSPWDLYSWSPESWLVLDAKGRAS